jgi:chitin disaccharide deacetylase
VRRLIINADDFGLTSGVNRGILEAHASGIVTSATLMACGNQFQEAASLAAHTPHLSVGCHVLLVDGSPVLNRTEVSTLLANSDSRFRESLGSFALQAVTGRLNQDQIEAEVTAQIGKLQAAGIRVSHLDSHKHTHMFPVVFKALLRAAKKCGVPAIRNPFEPLLFVNMQNWKRRFQLGLLRRYRSSFRQELALAGLVTPDGCIGIVTTGGLNQGTFQKLVENLPEGTWEFVSHPGYNDRDLSRIHTRLRDSREKELAILTSQAAKDVVRREGIQLISYRDLAQT